VLWAMATRCDPAKDIEIITDCWSTPLKKKNTPPAAYPAVALGCEIS
jgi:3-polyprenyl-4-hydroxybenzoate decarboxylase